MKLFYGWVNVAVLLIVYMLLMMPVLLTFGIILEPMTAALGISTTVASFAYSVMSLLSGLCAVVAGALAKKIGNKQAIIFGAGLVMAGGLLMYFCCYSVIVLYLCYILFFSAGLTIGTILPINTIISQWFQKKRGAAMAVVSCGAGLAGFIINPLMARVLERTNDWRNIYLWIAGFAMICLVLAALLVKNHPSDMNLNPDGAEAGEPKRLLPSTESAENVLQEEIWTIGQARHTRAFYLLVLAVGICSFTQTSVNTHAIPHLTNVGMQATVAASIVGTFSFFSIPSRLLSGLLCDRINSRMVLIIGYSVLLCGIIALRFTTSIPVGYSFAVLTGLGYGLTYASLSPLIASYFGSENFGLIYGAIYSVSALINASAPTLMGVCKDLIGDYSLAWSLLIVLVLVALVGSMLLKKPDHMLDAH